MEVFKFGGASVRDADSVRNLYGILNKYTDVSLVVIVSAMGKITNLLEAVWRSENLKEQETLLKNFKDFHLEIARDLLTGDNTFFEWFDDLLSQLEHIVEKNDHSDRYYSETVAFGELVSTKLIQEYFNSVGYQLGWLDARKLVKTDGHFTNAQVDWDLTTEQIKSIISFSRGSGTHYITQGFIASDQNGITTTLGREGSDYSGGIFASILKAEMYTIWKDVPGVLSADPRIMKSPSCYDQLTYQEAAEMTYYGVKAIHPRTIKPLANRDIPLRVRSFIDTSKSGTLISRESTRPHTPAVIYRFNQVLVTFIVADFTFVNEDHLSDILNYMHQQRVSVNMMQISAVSISLCVDYDEEAFKLITEKFRKAFKIMYNSDLKLATVKNHDATSIKEATGDFEILLEQKTRHNYRAVFKGNLEEPS